MKVYFQAKISLKKNTGTFRYLNHNNAETLLIAKELVEAGKLDIQVEELKFSQYDDTDLEIVAELLKNTKKVDLADGLSFMYSYISNSFLDNYSRLQVDNGKTKYTSIFLRQLKGYDWGFVVTPRDKESFYVSFRSTPGKANVRMLANVFDGGGHDLAAGAQIAADDSVKDSIDAAQKVVNIIKNTKLEIVKTP